MTIDEILLQDVKPIEKIIQISTTSEDLFALTNCGSVYVYSDFNRKWFKYPELSGNVEDKEVAYDEDDEELKHA